MTDGCAEAAGICSRQTGISTLMNEVEENDSVWNKNGQKMDAGVLYKTIILYNVDDIGRNTAGWHMAGGGTAFRNGTGLGGRSSYPVLSRIPTL